MDIGPIAGIRVTPLLKIAPEERNLPVVFDMEALARPVDDTWSGNSGSAAEGQDDQAEEFNTPEDAVSSDDPRRVDFFA